MRTADLPDTVANPAPDDAALPVPGWRGGAVRVGHALIEGVVLALVVLSPWAFGSVHPLFEFALYAGVAVLLVLWGTCTLIEGRLTWQRCPVALCLAGLFLLGAFQLAPLPRPLLDRLSPATVRLNDDLLPSRSEQLAPGTPAPAISAPAGGTISLYPGATRHAMLRLLAVFLLFAVVRNTIASAAGLRRLCLAALANGVLLTLLALGQFVGSPRRLIYWTYHVGGDSYGPFICRNHFPFYVNVCLGLGVGLLLLLLTRRARGRDGDASFAPAALLQHPAALWTCVALAVAAGGVAVSLSRGGLAALFAGALVCLLVRWLTTRRLAGVEAGLVTALVAVGLVAWLGWPQLEARLATLWREDALEVSRLPLWSAVVPRLREFPVWGTGLGTFRYVEPLGRHPGQDPTVLHEHGHNDYLEALVEGGGVGLLLVLGVVGLVFFLAYRAYRRHQDGSAGALALGGLFAFTTVVVHSAVDFGLHVPAIAFLVIVLAAHLSALGAGRRAPVRFGGLAALAGAGAAVVFGLLLAGEGWRLSQAERFRLAARYRGDRGGADAPAEQVAYLEAAVRWAPEDAALHTALAEAYVAAYQEGETAQDHVGRATAPGRALLALAGAGLPGPASPALPAVSAWLASDAAWAEGRRAEEAVRSRRYVTPALGQYLQARDLCPLLPEPQLQIGRLADRLAAADPPRAYFGRAARLDPSEPEVWYLLGGQQLADGDPHAAWASWRRSLECSDRHLADILAEAGATASPADLAGEVLPDRPDLLVRAADELPQGEDEEERRRLLLQRALELFRQTGPGDRTAGDLHLEAVVLERLDRPKEALDAYQAALVRDPGQPAWRYEFARLLDRQGREQDALREVRRVLHDQPNHPEARQLLEAVLRGPADSR
jgi:O-antigen ligase/tetratricopeptide (TPR) repeat protein